MHAKAVSSYDLSVVDNRAILLQFCCFCVCFENVVTSFLDCVCTLDNDADGGCSCLCVFTIGDLICTLQNFSGEKHLVCDVTPHTHTHTSRFENLHVILLVSNTFFSKLHACMCTFDVLNRKADLSESTDKLKYKHIVVLDLNGFGFKHASKKFFGQIKSTIDIDQYVFPLFDKPKDKKLVSGSKISLVLVYVFVTFFCYIQELFKNAFI